MTPQKIQLSSWRPHSSKLFMRAHLDQSYSHTYPACQSPGCLGLIQRSGLDLAWVFQSLRKEDLTFLSCDSSLTTITTTNTDMLRCITHPRGFFPSYPETITNDLETKREQKVIFSCQICQSWQMCVTLAREGISLWVDIRGLDVCD